jgi:hypothetical protein
MVSCAAVLTAASSTTLVGCDLFGPADAEPASIAVYPSELSLAPGDTAWLDYIVRDRRGRELEGVSVRWQVPSNRVVSVNSNGRVIGYTPGVTRITATRDDIAGGAYVAVGTIRFDNVRDLAIATFRDKYGLELTDPAIAPDWTTANVYDGLPFNRPTDPRISSARSMAKRMPTFLKCGRMGRSGARTSCLLSVQQALCGWLSWCSNTRTPILRSSSTRIGNTPSIR